jgi:hypothetical protein
VVHIRSDHIENGALSALSLRPFNCHLFQLQYIVVGQHLQQFDFAKCGDREAVLLVVHQDLLERIDLAGTDMTSHVNLSECALSELLCQSVFADLCASAELSRNTLGRRRLCGSRHRECGLGRKLYRWSRDC